MLTADDFSEVLWEQLRKAAGSPKALAEQLRVESKETIAEWYNEFIRAARNLWQSGVPAYLKDASDDTRADIFEYVVGQGKEYYSTILANPERVPRDVYPDDAAFKGAAVSVYWDRFQEDIPRRSRS